MNTKKDIENRKDIRTLVSTFHKELLKDPEFEHIFNEVAQIDILDHLDIMVDFWESVLFQAGKYKRDLLEIHVELNQKYNYGLKKAHFNKWLAVFNNTVDNLFEGKTAKGAKDRALSIASIIKMKIDDLEKMRMEINN